MALKLVWVDTQNLCSTLLLIVWLILDLWLTPFDKALVLEEYLLWCSGLVLHCNRKVALASVSLIARRKLLSLFYFCIDIITVLGVV